MKILIVTDNIPKNAQRVMNMASLMSQYGSVTIMSILGKELISNSDAMANEHKTIWIEKSDHRAHWNDPYVIRKFRSFLHQCLRILNQNCWFHDYSNSNSKLSRRIKFSIAKEDFDAAVIHHTRNIPFALKVLQERNIPIFLNLHEYYPEEHSQSAIWVRGEQKFSNYICRKYLKEFSGCFAVCQSILDRYKSNFGGKYILFRNTKDFFDLRPSQNNSKKIHLVHHGIANRSRQIESYIHAINLLNGQFHLHLFLTQNPSDTDYYMFIEDEAKKSPHTDFHSPVPTNEIPIHINKYDAALSIVPNSNFNELCMLPNKLFESIQARLMIIVGNSPEMKSIIEKYDLGISIAEPTPQCIAEELRKIDRDAISYYKSKSHDAAYELSTEMEIERVSKELKHLGVFEIL